MVDTAAMYWVYWRGRKAFAASRESRRRFRTACHEAQSLHSRLTELQHEIAAEVSRARQQRGPAPSARQPLTSRP